MWQTGKVFSWSWVSLKLHHSRNVVSTNVFPGLWVLFHLHDCMLVVLSSSLPRIDQCSVTGGFFPLIAVMALSQLSSCKLDDGWSTWSHHYSSGKQGSDHMESSFTTDIKMNRYSLMDQCAFIRNILTFHLYQETKKLVFLTQLRGCGLMSNMTSVIHIRCLCVTTWCQVIMFVCT